MRYEKENKKRIPKSKQQIQIEKSDLLVAVNSSDFL